MFGYLRSQISVETSSLAAGTLTCSEVNVGGIFSSFSTGCLAKLSIKTCACKSVPTESICSSDWQDNAVNSSLVLACARSAASCHMPVLSRTFHSQCLQNSDVQPVEAEGVTMPEQRVNLLCTKSS